MLIDGKAQGAAHGIAVDEQGYGTLTSQHLDQLVRQTGPTVDRRFEIEFLEPVPRSLRSSSDQREERKVAPRLPTAIDPAALSCCCCR
ncbi:hypothetical protein [Mesorhizobium sp. ANAO-SY3R2]|uniref:hypothetical protein n=1 Tax=Mesorhizobium sp. ANAO-SY3R2 TaxID=3166644 RepID=UPI0036720E6D